MRAVLTWLLATKRRQNIFCRQSLRRRRRVKRRLKTNARYGPPIPSASPAQKPYTREDNFSGGRPEFDHTNKCATRITQNTQDSPHGYFLFTYSLSCSLYDFGGCRIHFKNDFLHFLTTRRCQIRTDFGRIGIQLRIFKCRIKSQSESFDLLVRRVWWQKEGPTK